MKIWRNDAMKKNVTIAIHEEKLAALEMYLPQRRTAAGDLPPNSPNGEKVGRGFVCRTVPQAASRR